MKKIGVLAVVMAMAFLFVGVASAEMYVEGYLGAAWSDSIGQNFTEKELAGGTPAGDINAFRMKWGGHTDVTVIGGGKIGTWFVKEGTLGFGYPEWMKYLGFYTDLSFQRLYTPNQRISGIVRDIGPTSGADSGEGLIGSMKTDGTVVTWAFMFAARYGFFKDSEVPFGRLQPYLAVGPAIMFSSMKPKFAAFGGPEVNTPMHAALTPNQQGSTDIALAADAGIRFMALKNVSFDISFKYRYAAPTYTFGGVDAAEGVPATFKLTPTYNLFSTQVGVAYHF
jgi:hypothetical protein